MANRLADEPSPYLRQHAGNPVDWWPWGEEAFAQARRRDIPLFVSIGYATCHWCHVMAHESFEDPEVARLLNEAFVCVKVDREERPDVDDVYMAACQMMTGAGGWPLTVLLTPDKKPFFAGTYFPRESRHGRLGMLDLVPRIAQAWKDKRTDIEAQADHFLLHLAGTPHGHGDEPVPAKVPDPAAGLLEAGAQAIAQRFDAKHGGFGGAPKFPSPHLLLLLLRQWSRDGNPETLGMAVRTLDAMALGGIHDHLGGGFHRYSTDAAWLLPHFEKMLYDQAMLAIAYAEAFAATGEARHAQVARSTLDYVLRELQDPAGGLRCAEDADSEGIEGRHYVWTRADVLAVLGAAEGEWFCRAYGVTAEGNVHDEATGMRTGANVLHLVAPLADADAARAKRMRTQLLAVRRKRVRPLLDDKVLTDWNGLAIAALAIAGQALHEPHYTAAAVRVADFLRNSMRRGDGRLRHRFHAGRKDDVAFLDDTAFLLWGLVELYGATQDPRHLAWAIEVAGGLKRDFADPAGGYFQAPANGEDLGVRRKEAYDGAIPSGNSAAAYALHKLGLLTGDASWTRQGDEVLRAFAQSLDAAPASHAMMLCALDLAVGPTQEIVVAGDGPDSERMMGMARAGFHPRRVVLRVVPDLVAVAPWTAEHKAPAGQARAFACEGNACKAPVATAAQLQAILAKG